MIYLSCSTDQSTDESASPTFSKISSSLSGIDFENTLKMTEEYNPYTFKNFLNGGGVAIGDINQDGLEDIFLTGNLVENQFYLNKGGLQFENISDQSNLSCPDVWCTGASMVDINHDGLLDVYICKSGKPDTPNRFNQMFINNGDLSFTDKAKEFGLDFVGLSIHSAFFDYDLDGDLDCYLLNNSLRSVGGYDMAEGLRDIPDPSGGNKLLKNLEAETGKISFQDVTQEAGIYSSAIGFGLGVSVSDINDDGWPDLFVSNDFFEKDYLYINQKDGTFSESVTSSMSELSTGSMGADIADINNDARPDLFVTEMLPQSLERYKSKVVFESYDKQRLNVSKGYHHQYGRNVLQQQIGIQEGQPIFVELGRYHGVEATDWSWGALMADFDNNGWKDIFVANGILKDLLDQDHINFYDQTKIGAMVKSGNSEVIMEIMEAMPSVPLHNQLFIQTEEQQFEPIKINDKPGFSNGAAYADLDQDGDLELLINNVNNKASLLINNSQENHWIGIHLKGQGLNSMAIGSKVIAYAQDKKWMQELHPMRGYQSSAGYKMMIGLGKVDKIDSLHIRWPDLTSTMYENLSVDSLYIFRQGENTRNHNLVRSAKKTYLQKTEGFLDYEHKGNSFVDFDRNRMMIHGISNESPNVKKLDWNKDGQMDLLISGCANQASVLYLQSEGSLIKKSLKQFEENARKETTDVLMEDLDNDNQFDIYLVNGGIQWKPNSPNLQDQWFTNINDGDSNRGAIPAMVGSYALAIDLDKASDEKKEIILTARMTPNAYGSQSDAQILHWSEGKLIVDEKLTKPLQALGMITDLDTIQLTKDSEPAIIFAREHNSLAIYSMDENEGVLKSNNKLGLDAHKGMWSDIELVDIDLDGDEDIVAANYGLNHRFKNLGNGELHLFVKDFDNNGRIDLIYCTKVEDKYYPLHLKDELMMQMPKLKKKSLKYHDYSKASLVDLLGEEAVNEAEHLFVNEFRSGVFINNNGTFSFQALPKQVQYSKQKAIWAGDINNDGYPDLILGGNQFMAKPEFGMQAASKGHVLINVEGKDFKAIEHEVSGFFEDGQIRDIESIKINNKTYLFVFKYNEKVSVYKINNYES